jgi:hypothetical protein
MKRLNNERSVNKNLKSAVLELKKQLFPAEKSINPNGASNSDEDPERQEE